MRVGCEALSFFRFGAISDQVFVSWYMNISNIFENGKFMNYFPQVRSRSHARNAADHTSMEASVENEISQIWNQTQLPRCSTILCSLDLRYFRNVCFILYFEQLGRLSEGLDALGPPRGTLAVRQHSISSGSENQRDVDCIKNDKGSSRFTSNIRSQNSTWSIYFNQSKT